MIRRRFRIFLFVAALAWGAGPAYADTFDLGELPIGTESFDHFVAAGAFADTYNFSLTAAHNTAIAVTDVELFFGVINLYDIGGLAFGLYDSGDSLLSTPGALSYSGTLAAGVYHFDISGSGVGAQGGYYAGLVDVAPVPEIGVWLMMLAGMGLVGLRLGRRQAPCRDA